MFYKPCLPLRFCVETITTNSRCGSYLREVCGDLNAGRLTYVSIATRFVLIDFKFKEITIILQGK